MRAKHVFKLVTNPSEKWGGLRTFHAVVVFVVVFFCFMFSFFDSYFVEFLAAFNCGEVLWKKIVLKIFESNNQQFVSRQNLLRNT